MTYWSHSPAPSRTSISSQSHILRTLKVPQPTTTVLKSLINFYQEEQYWVHRTRTTLKRPSIDDIFLTSPLDTSPDLTRPSSPLIVPSRPPTSLSVSLRHDSTTDDASGAPMALDVELTMDGEGTAHASSWVRRQNRMRLKAGGVTPKHKHRKALAASPPQSSVRMLDMFSDLMDARMESCQRVSRLVEMRRYYYF